MGYSFIIPATFLLSISLSQGQTIQRKSAETTEQFATRLKPRVRQLAHPVLETTAWGGQKAIIALYGYDDTKDDNIGYNRIEGHIYLQESPGQYRNIAFGPIEEDGGYPEILSVFFANSDTDAAKELIILCKYPQNHYDYEGAFYETFIFDNPGQKNQLTYLKKTSEKFTGCECDWRDGKTEIAKYKTAAAVKSRLKGLGFKQQ
ncbi:hypothetical protein [Hymenobacter convexus]|uniref:hypothetical protein n=1 Tax=Hymenobacter sp. CA1UV-4 TaxID=3063782 RepID=UPI0027139642|nr:hypothetical protein [Hymenobacter sp. CA1UV-4]MDO7853371.1 hypothetical protein [Hymenobacter sp. CA1UV-4]